jgi:hypothetical protein
MKTTTLILTLAWFSLPAWAGEPAAPAGPVVDRIKALGNNSWLKLETPEVHPVSRSASSWMACAPEAGVGILWGCSHASHENDVWTPTHISSSNHEGNITYSRRYAKARHWDGLNVLCFDGHARWMRGRDMTVDMWRDKR